MRQDETYRLDLADLQNRFKGRQSVMTYSRGNHAQAWLGIEPSEGYMRLTWTNKHNVPIGPPYTIWTTQTQQPFGGLRKWLLCPHCDNKARVLYWRGSWACTKCVRLTYMSQLEKPYDYALTRAQRIRRQLGGDADMTTDFPPKPPNMHWRTYWALQDEHDREANYYTACMMAWIMGRRTRYKVNGRKVSESEGKAALARLSPSNDDTARTWGKVSDYVTPHDATDNRPTHKPDRPACAMVTKSGAPCRSKAKQGFTICHRHLETVGKYL